MNDRSEIRLLIIAILLFVLIASTPRLFVRAFAAGKPTTFELDATKAQPREIEDATKSAVERDYTNAWAVLKSALRDNRGDQLENAFVGRAFDKLTARVQSQRSNGLHTRITDTGHHLQALFYSSEGSTMELQDAVTMKLEVLEGSNVVHTEDATVNYIVLMSVAEDRWKIRVLQEQN